jgi:glycosyltransferase involved in cell wall biosynthesis
MILRWLFYHTLVRLSWASAAAGKLEQIKKDIGKIDIIEYPECGAEGFFVRKNPGMHTIVRLHTPWYIVRKINTIRECPGDHLLFQLFERYSISKANHITAPTKAILSLVKIPENSNTVNILPNPLILPVQPKHTERKQWIFSGRVERRKGVSILIDAYLKLCQNLDPPDLLLLGAPYGIDRDDISYENKIEQRIANSPHSKKIRWIKGVVHESVQEYLSQSSIAFFPSLWENLSYACLEAMATGCIVVASDCGGFREIISNGVNGILVETGNVNRWFEIMSDLVTKEHSFDGIGTAAKEHVYQYYSSETVCLKTEEIYLNCIRKTDVKR